MSRLIVCDDELNEIAKKFAIHHHSFPEPLISLPALLELRSRYEAHLNPPDPTICACGNKVAHHYPMGGRRLAWDKFCSNCGSPVVEK